MKWENIADRLEREAAAILEERGIPSSWEEWRSNSIQPKDHMESTAMQVVFGCHSLREYAENGKTTQALDKLLDIVSAYEEMDILATVPEYENRPLLTDTFFGDIKKGVINRNSIIAAHEAQHGTQEEKKATWTKYQQFIDNKHRDRPGLSYEACANLAHKHFGVSIKTIKRRTKNWK